MTQDERLDYLLSCLLGERADRDSIPLPDRIPARQRLLRALMNVRPPIPADPAFLQVQDEYLQAVRAEKGVTQLSDLTPVRPGLYLWQGDITTLVADAIVNAANGAMLGCFVPCHGCIDNAIHSAAGVQLRLECARIMAQQQGGGTHRTRQNYKGVQPALPVCAAHGRADHTRHGDQAGQGAPGFLLPLLSGAGSHIRAEKRCVLLHLDRGIPFPE